MSDTYDDVTLLLIGSLVAVTLVAMLLRGGRREHVPYSLLLVGDLVALILARSLPSDALAFVAEAAGLLLSLSPWLLDTFERRLVRTDRLHGALRVAKLRELLVPGTGSARRRRELERLVTGRKGDPSRAITALETQLKDTRDADEALQLRIDLVLLHLAAGQEDTALELAERKLGPDAYQRSPELTAQVSSALSARGRLLPAVQLLMLLEAQSAASPDQRAVQSLLTTARLRFIAGAGLTEPVEQLLGQKATREELSAIEADRLRAIAATATAPSAELTAIARQVARRMIDIGARMSAPVRRRAPATLILIAVNVSISVLLGALGLDDMLGLARAGALYAPAIMSGEPWRLVTMAWLHAGPVHLGITMLALYFLGRATEELLGWPRLVVIYAVSCLGGAFATLWSDRSIGVGSSGGVMGLLAGLAVVIYCRRQNFHPVARRVLLGNLIFVAVLQAFLDSQSPLVDSAGHAGGFVTGLIATLGLQPAIELSKVGTRIVRAVAIAYAVVCVTTIPLVIRTPLQQTLLRLPTKSVELDGVHLTIPRAWRRENDRYLDPYLGIDLSIKRQAHELHLVSAQADDPRVRPLLERIHATMHNAGATL